MKTCTKCKEEKDETEFRVRNKAKGTRSPWCKVCFSQYEREKWTTSPERRKSNMERNIKRRHRNAQFVWDYLKEHPCIGCGENDPIVLEFDHRDRADKVGNISEMIMTAISQNRIEAEIEKCDVLCVKCHRRRTAEQMGWYKNIVK